MGRPRRTHCKHCGFPLGTDRVDGGFHPGCKTQWMREYLAKYDRRPVAKPRSYRRWALVIRLLTALGMKQRGEECAL